MDRKAFSFALKASVPVLLGYVTTGIAFGLLLQAAGFGAGWAFLMSLVCYAGSMQFVAINLLTGCAGIIEVIIMTLLINCRHMVYGFSMLDKFRVMGKRKPYMIFSLTDETYALISGTQVPTGIHEKNVYFYISMLNQVYWIIGGLIGNVAGSLITFNTRGLDFAMTALFLTICTDQWRKFPTRIPAIIGAGITIISLLLFGADKMIIPAMLAIILLLSVFRPQLEPRVEKTEVND